jgi:hypothetical protein
MRAVGMAIGATRRVGKIGAARDRIGLGGQSRRRREHDGGNDRPYCAFARNVL